MRKVVRGRTILAVAGLALFAAAVPAAWAQNPEPAASKAEGIGAPAVQAARVTPDLVASGLNLIVSHRMIEGRLVVKVGTQAVLSAPFSAIKPGANGWFERPLSVECGRQTVTVLVIDGAGRLVAQQATEANLAAAGTATLAVAEHGGSGKGLTLEWRTP